MATALSPADLTVINTSGHGGHFDRMLARSLAIRGRPYIAMIGGLHATVSGAQQRYFQQAAAIAVHNAILRDQLVAQALPASKIVVLPLGVDVDRFSPGVGSRAFPRNPSLLFVGRLDALKGVETLLREFAIVRGEYSTITLKLVGPAPSREYLQRLEHLVKTLAIGDAVSFLGAVDYEALPRLYREASLFILPSTAEGFGMVVVESMACGTPVIALRNSGGPSEIITDHVDGRLVEKDQLAATIASLISDPTKVMKMRDEARRSAVARYSEAVTTDAFRDLLSRGLNDHRRQ